MNFNFSKCIGDINDDASIDLYVMEENMSIICDLSDFAFIGIIGLEFLSETSFSAITAHAQREIESHECKRGEVTELMEGTFHPYRQWRGSISWFRNFRDIELF